MKRIVCEMCDGVEFVKQDGMFICQGCGCKYTVEEAKKMMVETPDEAPAAPVAVPAPVSTVKVDNSSELDNLYMLARRAKDDNNAENAAKYYDLILLKDATSWEASFYLVYFKAMECKIAQIQSAAHSVENCLGSVIGLIRDNVSNDSEKISALTEVSLRCSLIANMLYNGAENHYNGIDSDIRSKYTQECINNCCAARDILYTCGDQIDKHFGEDHALGGIAASAWKEGIRLHKKILPRLANQALNQSNIREYAEKIGKYDAAYWKAYTDADNKRELKEELDRLNLRVTNLQNTINNTPTERKINCFGWFFFIVGGIMLVLSLVLISMDPDQWWFLAIAIFELLLGLLGRTPKAQVEANRAAVAKARQELPAAREALAKFRQEHPDIR